MNSIRGPGHFDLIDQALDCLVDVSSLQVKHLGLVQALVGGAAWQFGELIKLAEFV